jgi:hypothetical protein
LTLIGRERRICTRWFDLALGATVVHTFVHEPRRAVVSGRMA